MAVSKEVQDVLDKARAAQTYRASTAAAMSALQKQNDDQKAKIDALTAQVQAIPANKPLSDEDKSALLEAAQDLSDGAADTSDAIDQAHDAIPANVTPGSDTGGATGATGASSGGSTGSTGATGATGPAVPPPVGHAPDAVAPPVGEPIHTDEQLAANGPANAPAGGLAPLMPTLAFDPAPGGVAAGADGQPSQAPTIATAGGFVVAGGGTTARAVGSQPDSPSSTLVIPADPNAKAPASTADLAKSGLGDSSANALTDNSGTQVIRDDVSGQVAVPPSGQPAPAPIPTPSSDPAVQQAQADKLDAQKQMAADQAAQNQAAADQAKADQAAADKAKSDQAAAAAQDKTQVQQPS